MKNVDTGIDIDIDEEIKIIISALLAIE
jgi:hypothetical protein